MNLYRRGMEDKLKTLQAAYEAASEAKRLLLTLGPSSLWGSCVDLQDDIYSEMAAERRRRNLPTDDID